MFDEDLAIKTILGIKDDSINVVDVIRAYAEARGTEIDYNKSFHSKSPTIVDNTGVTIAMYCNAMIKVGEFVEPTGFSPTINFKENDEHKFTTICGGIYFPKTNSVLMASDSNIDYYNSDSCAMANAISNIKDTCAYPRGIYEGLLVDFINDNDIIKPDKSFETDIQHFAETFRKATELVKAPEAKHM